MKILIFLRFPVDLVLLYGLIQAYGPVWIHMVPYGPPAACNGWTRCQGKPALKRASQTVAQGRVQGTSKAPIKASILHIFNFFNIFDNFHFFVPNYVF